MGIETATFIADLVSANPGAADLRSQGDDHLRLLKAVLQSSFPTASKAWYNPTFSSKSADFTVVASDMNKTFYVSTAGGTVNMTLPSLGAGDAGWECFMMKSSTGTSPVMIKPAAGTLTSSGATTVTAARRSIPFVRIQCLWSGTGWVISRALGTPIGSLVDLMFANLPVGYEWPTGQTLTSASTLYQEFYALNGNSGVTFDIRGRVGVALDNLGGVAAGRVSGFLSGTTLGAAGGVESITLITANLPPYTPSGSNGAISVTSVSSTILTGSVLSNTFNFTPGGGSILAAITNSTLLSAAQVSTGAAPSFTGNAQGGTSNATSNLQPSIIVSKILVVE